MTSIEDILTIADRLERQSALAGLARSLGLDQFSAKLDGDRYNEEKLVLMIFDALQERTRGRRKDVQSIRMGVLIGIFVLLFIFFVSRKEEFIYQDRSELSPARRGLADSKAKASQMKNSDAASPATLDGIYTENDGNGQLLYEYFYRNGQLIWRKRFDSQGKVVAEDKFLPK